MRDTMTSRDIAARMPSWVPKETFAYLAHTEAGASLRELARDEGVHASTVLRQVRALEARREDVLVDRLLSRLGRRVRATKTDEPRADSPQHLEEEIAIVSEHSMLRDPEDDADEMSEAQLNADASRILSRLVDANAVMAVAVDMDKAVVVRETASGSTTRSAVVDREVAEALALKCWIVCEKPGRVSRYRITAAGRKALGKMVAEVENRAVGFAEASAPFLHADADESATQGDRARLAAPRFQSAETPLALLARRRDQYGNKFLPAELVTAGERLREDFELAGLSPRKDQNWDQFLTSANITTDALATGSSTARKRVLGALRDLGPGLGDAALRCCCYLEGLESTEKNMGWSARSGKIVLRIALQRLKRHYEELGEAGAMLG